MKEWRCLEGCQSDCCGIVPIPIDVAKRNESKQQCKVSELVMLEKEVVPMTDDIKCVFLNRKTFKCMIYSERPTVCRLYGLIPRLPCPYMNYNGKERTPAKTRRMQRFISKKVDEDMAKINRILANIKGEADRRSG